jgi:hypothetical protein
MNPEDLFKRAYERQLARRFAEALALYRQLVREFPDCDRAAVARQQIQNLRAFDVQGAENDGSTARNDSRGSEPGSGAEQSATATFKCVRCHVLIRISLEPSADIFRCAQCRHRYSFVMVRSDPKTILIVPEAILSATQAGAGAARAWPPKVKDAFALLGIEPTEDLPAVKRAYRQLIAQYHPDTVAHLGLDLRRLAEDRTKAFVAALQVIESFLGS